MEELHETKLLGLKIRADLSWKSNTSVLTRKAYSRMLIIKKLVQFDVPLEDLLHIYGLYIRSVTEQSAVVWHSAITKGAEMEYCASAASMLAEEFWQIAEGFVEGPVNL